MEKIFETKESNADKVCVFPKLEEIHITKMKRLRDIWHTKVNFDSFSSLISVNIEKCNKLDKIFPSNMEGWFESLDNLKVSKCQSVETIFEIKDSQEIDASGGISTNLQVILLEKLPKLKELWNTNPNGILNFRKLRIIEVYGCGELKNLFPASVAKDVSNLERMSILYCQEMVEIITCQDASEAIDDPLEFPELTYVRLYGLPNIKYFYKGRYPIKCPKLKELSVNECLKLKTFYKEISKTSEEEESFVFSAQKVLSKLEYMEIDFMEAQNLLPKYPMHYLKELSLISVEGVDFLNQFPYRMPNLEKLKLSFSIGFEPRANLAQQERLVIALELKELILLNATIKDLGFPILRRLELLSLEQCHGLSNLNPPSLSFTYLTCLKLKNCRGLRNLMASSTAKSMVQLKIMKVIDCHKVEEIVSNEGSEEGMMMMKIEFSKLISIELVGLRSMTSFCSYKECEFEFPSLEILIIRECLKMEKFSVREPIAPKIKDVFGVEGDEKTKWHWEGNLNATIHKIFSDKHKSFKW
ncbi:uncharacterized protein LOC114165593 [Vigna unguiculata]|uniref:uncharacterized protein LOC114165593 n=1 Tax=Vigna unguiculata TaxID=3917 RepID=UPI001016898B|nr:uncharacterized protein LOC114165593 [Vigna unguiculata]